MTHDITLEPTPGQTVGPFFAFGLNYERMNRIVEPGSEGAVRLQGVVRDGNGDAVPDALIELWGANPAGEIARAEGSIARSKGGSGEAGRSEFTGFGRCPTDDEGRFEFWTLTPGAAQGRAPFWAVVVFARGLPDRLHTRIYVPGDDAALNADPLLSRLTADQRATLVATRTEDGHLHRDVWLQGDKETVFIAY